jgi:uncharacterized YccA/Bax inhibitor family protein
MRTSNPVFSNRFERYAQQSFGTVGMGTMTIEGTATKTGILLLLLLMSSTFVWYLFFAVQDYALVFLLVLVGLIGGLVVAFITIFKPAWASATAPVYAILEGLMLGGISALFELVYPGILVQAIALTFGVFALVLVLYRFRILRATPRFAKGVIAATFAIMIVYVIGFLLSFFGVRAFFFYDSSPISIGFSVFVVAIASLNLVLDFGFIEDGANRGAPKYLEWYAAFGLLVTLIWLYIEIIRLLAKLRSR